MRAEGAVIGEGRLFDIVTQGVGDLLGGGGSLEPDHLFEEIRYVEASRLTSLVSVNRHKRSNKVCHKKDGFDQKERKHQRAKRASVGDAFGLW